MNDTIEKLLKREGTGISWADLTFNPWIGCQKVSPACDNCYAETLATTRLGVAWGPGAERRRTAPGNWSKPARWNRYAEEAGIRLKVFCASLADVFDNAVDPLWREELGALIHRTPALDWMLLTKRIGNVRTMAPSMFGRPVPPNVALGVTVPNQDEADRDLPRALAIKQGLGIRRLFLSMEPLLGTVDISRFLQGVDLVIVGGESGRDARPMNPVWAESLRDQCAEAGVPFHFKQWGEWADASWLGDGTRLWTLMAHEEHNDPAKETVAWPDGTFSFGTAEEHGGRGVRMIKSTKVAAGHLLAGKKHREHFA
jgi:protein gp37